MAFFTVSPSNHTKVIVVGSLNIDQICRVDYLPTPGETVNATDLEKKRGGKGANQAIAASRQGVEVAMIGAIGDDEEGQGYLRHLKEEEDIDTRGISLSPFPTGSAFITVEDGTGENTIIVAGGANETLTRTDIADMRGLIETGTVLLAQFEVPTKSVIEAIRLASRADIPVVVNPSPFVPNFPWEEVPIDHVIVNQHEAEELLDFTPDQRDPETVRQELHELRIKNLIVTRGSETTLVFTNTGYYYEVEPLPVLPIDTVGAGDAFAGCYAARIAQGKTVEDAVRAANCAGALTTLGGGAQKPIPDRDRVDQHLEQIPKRKKIVRNLS